METWVPVGVLTFFVPGKLVNPMNGSHGHWRTRMAWAQQWKGRTWAVLHDAVPRECFRDPERPKHVTFTAFTGAEWKDDNLRAALKPVRDALMGRELGPLVAYRLIHSDAPDSGHVFEYQQRIDRKHRGVRITIRALGLGTEAGRR